MKTIRTLTTGIVLLFLAAVLHSCNTDETARPFRIMLNPTATPATGMALAWRTKSPVQLPAVQLRTAIDSPDLETSVVTVPATSEHVRLADGTTVYHYSSDLTDLNPGHRYTYRVGSTENWSEWNDFRTATERFEPFSFVYLGDPQNDILSRCARVFRAAFVHAPDARFWLIPGDLVNRGDNDPLWGELFDAMGWITRTTPIVAVPGNHEYFTGKKGNWKDDVLTPLWRPHFNFPENGPEGLEESCFTILYQDVRFIMLNGNERIREQAAWMAKVLENNTARWTIVSMHQPCYPAIDERDIPELREILVPLYDRYNVDLILQGHDHTYARTYPLKNGKPVPEGESGTVYTISVSGPKMYDPAKEPAAIMARTGSNTQLYQVIHVERDRLVYESYTVTGQLFDRFELDRTGQQQ